MSLSCFVSRSHYADAGMRTARQNHILKHRYFKNTFKMTVIDPNRGAAPDRKGPLIDLEAFKIGV